ncbi:DUF6126 family protein [Streptomyces sp. HSW2009]|uniref:DUF6126 family protein n=1 Tax=Streptomyces sp. HSW2009 TaxID=3142890 RepID=UPI0032EED46D
MSGEAPERAGSAEQGAATPAAKPQTMTEQPAGPRAAAEPAEAATAEPRTPHVAEVQPATAATAQPAQATETQPAAATEAQPAEADRAPAPDATTARAKEAAAAKTKESESWLERGVAIRVGFYVFGTHLFAGFIWLLFYLGQHANK